MISTQLILLAASLVVHLVQAGFPTDYQYDEDDPHKEYPFPDVGTPYCEKRNRIFIPLERSFGPVDPHSSARSFVPEMSYVGVMNIGTPAQAYHVAFDSTLNETWLSSGPSQRKEGFDCMDSSSCQRYGRDVRFNFRNTRMVGELYADFFMLHKVGWQNNRATTTVREVKFLQYFAYIDDGNLYNKPYVGVIGMAPRDRSDSGFRNILRAVQQSFASPIEPEQTPYVPCLPTAFDMVFSIYINPDQSSPDGGEVIFGGINEERFKGKLHFHKADLAPTWQLDMTLVKLGGVGLSCPNGCKVTFDTGGNSIVGPHDDVEEIYRQLEARYRPDANVWVVDCDRLGSFPTLAVYFNNILYPLYSNHYTRMVQHEGESICVLQIERWDQPDWVLGTSFMAAYYTVFDYGNEVLGFAPAR